MTFFFLVVLDNESDIQQDGIGHVASQSHSSNTTTTNKQNFSNFANTDLNGNDDRRQHVID